MTMDENVAKAVAAIDSHADDLRRCAVVLRAYPEMQPVAAEFSEAVGELTTASTTIRARLVELEAENARLRADCDLRFKQAMQNGQSAQVQRARAGKAEALLRELTKPNAGLFPDLVSRITAHLSENGQ